MLEGGRGGDGCSSFHREKYVPRGGPDGGDGGHGGGLALEATGHETTLLPLAGTDIYRAPKGSQGGPRGCTGRSADDRVLKVPVGTMVIDAEHGNLLHDLKEDGDLFVVSRGGRGGKGNSRFATSTNRAPRFCESGSDGERRKVRLSLKLIADVGLVGFPNAGKSTLLSSISAARPKVADYPFTTLEPHLGIVRAPFGSFVMADIPGLIEGAAEGKGLGDRFLRHIQRTKVLVHLVDCSSDGPEDPAEAARAIERELARSSTGSLADRPLLLVASKVEDAESRDRAVELAEAMGRTVIAISAPTGAGIPQLLAGIGELLK